MSERSPSIRFALRALAYRNYRLFFGGQIVSLIGTWMTRLASGWLVFRLAGADAPMLLGVVSFAALIPTLVLGPVAGVFVDRWDRHRVLVVTQILSLFQSAALPHTPGVIACQSRPGWRAARPQARSASTTVAPSGKDSACSNTSRGAGAQTTVT